MDPLTLVPYAISLIAIVTGLVVLAAMIGGRNRRRLTAMFLLLRC